VAEKAAAPVPQGVQVAAVVAEGAPVPQGAEAAAVVGVVSAEVGAEAAAAEAAVGAPALGLAEEEQVREPEPEEQVRAQEPEVLVREPEVAGLEAFPRRCRQAERFARSAFADSRP
jgi:hypothetical protein